MEKWRSTRLWAEQLLIDHFGLASASDILNTEFRGKNSIPNTKWNYRTHGFGVDISQSGNRGGIDFDFGETEPDEFRLREFMIKQYNAGSIPKKEYRPLIQDEERWRSAVNKALG